MVRLSFLGWDVRRAGAKAAAERIGPSWRGVAERVMAMGRAALAEDETLRG